jgi:hypothetical protein
MSIQFLTRLRVDDDKYYVEAFTTPTTKPTPAQVNNPVNWKCLFVGTKEEAYRFTRNLHDQIQPEMLGGFNPENPKRRLEH